MSLCHPWGVTTREALKDGYPLPNASLGTSYSSFPVQQPESGPWAMHAPMNNPAAQRGAEQQSTAGSLPNATNSPP